ncbi:MAG: hypothetical protein AB1627_14800, partial [Chloroflexota bacterium]
LGTLAGPSFRFAAPVGTGLAALGLAGILVGSLGGIPLGAGGATGGEENRELVTVDQLSSAAAQAPTAAPSVAPAPHRSGSGSPVPATGPDQAYSGASSPGTDTAAGDPGAPTIEAGPPGNVTDGGILDEDAQTGGKAAPDDAFAATGGRSAGELVAIVGAAALVAGLALLALRWTSRRLT